MGAPTWIVLARDVSDSVETRGQRRTVLAAVLDAGTGLTVHLPNGVRCGRGGPLLTAVRQTRAMDARQQQSTLRRMLVLATEWDQGRVDVHALADGMRYLAADAHLTPEAERSFYICWSMLDMERELAEFGRGSHIGQQYALANVRRWIYDALDSTNSDLE
jgi:hypothetical protein